MSVDAVEQPQEMIHLLPTNIAEEIDPDTARDWVHYSDALAPFDQKVLFDRGNGPEEVVLVDALNRRSVDSNNQKLSTPVVVLEKAGGERETVPAADYLRWTNFDSKAFREWAADHGNERGFLPIPEPQVTQLGDLAVSASVKDNPPKAENYDRLFIVDEEEELKAANMSPQERQALIEQAAVRAPGLYEVLAGVKKDNAGKYRPNSGQSKAIIEALAMSGGISEALLGDETVQRGITRARDLVRSDSAAGYLRKLYFVSEGAVNPLKAASKRVNVTLEGSEITVPSAMIVGAANFGSWLGRGYDGTGEVAYRGSGISHRSSQEQIMDYATRDTQLPQFDDLDLFLTEKGIFAFSNNAHRAAAAKLRGESVRASSFNLYDSRGNLNPEITATLEEMSSTVSQAI